MAKQIARLLRSELTVSDELSKIAKLLQSKGRGKDTILAHITPKEAELLKKLGGRGSRNPETGLLEFETDESMGSLDYGEDLRPVEAGPVAEAAPAPVEISGAGVEVPSTEDYTGGLASAAPRQYDPRFVQASLPSVQVPTAAKTALGGEAFPGAGFGPATPATAATTAKVPAVKTEKEFTDKLKDYLSDPANLAKLGLGIGGAGLGAMRARQGAKQIQAATEEQKALGAPYQAQGRELIRAAQSGELTPTSSQAYQAMQAQLAQSTATRGGVGAAQASAQLEAFRQQLLDNQYKFGLNVAQVGDSIALGAIKSGLQLDRQLQQATSNYYTSLAAMSGGLPIYQVAQTPPVA